MPQLPFPQLPGDPNAPPAPGGLGNAQPGQQTGQTNAFGQPLPLSPQQDYLGHSMAALKGLLGVEESDPNYRRSNLLGQLIGTGAGVAGPLMVRYGGMGLSVPERVQMAKKVGQTNLQELLTSGRSLPPDIMKALTFAQQKYPRLFGHLAAIHQLSSADQVTFNEAGQLVNRLGIQRPIMPSGEAAHISELGFHPQLAGDEATSTLGHEMAHAAQQLRQGPAFNENYHLANMAVGYDKNPYELTANVAGENFADAYKAAKWQELAGKQPARYQVDAETARDLQRTLKVERAKTGEPIDSVVSDPYRRRIPIRQGSPGPTRAAKEE